MFGYQNRSRRCPRRLIAARGAALAIVLATLQHATAAAATWADQLGYPAASRVVIVHAAQLGGCYASNQAAQSGFEQGAMTSAAVMPPAPWFGEFAEWYARHPDHDVGLALTMNSQRTHLRWGPIMPRTEVPSLVDADGFLWPRVFQTALNADREEVAREVEAQIQRARIAGVRPGHFALHLGALISRPDLAEVYLEAARKYWIPAVIIELTPDQIEQFRKMGFPLSNEMIELIRAYPLPKLDNLVFSPAAESYDKKRQMLFALLDDLQSGITQINFAPAVETEALKRIDPDWQQRVWDARLLADPALPARMAKLKITRTDWKEIMRRFEGREKAAEQDEP